MTLVFCGYGLLLVGLSPARLPTALSDAGRLPYLADKSVGEDGYYMLTVAWNIAQGRGIVYNFDQPTVGIQPLSTFVFAGLAKAVQLLTGGKWEFARVILGFGVVNVLIFAWLLGKVAYEVAPLPQRHTALVVTYALTRTCSPALIEERQA